ASTLSLHDALPICLRQLVPGHADRHPAPDAELPGRLARRHNDAAPPPLLRIRAYDDRLPDEVRILAALYADVESVHVHVEDDAGHGSEWTSFIIRLVSVTSVRVDFTGRRTRCPRDPALRPSTPRVPPWTGEAGPTPFARTP